MLYRKRNNINRERYGMVLEGGGAKGAYQAGVFMAMEELRFSENVTVVSGTSVGALNALLFTMRDRDLCERVWSNVGFETMFTPSEDYDMPSFKEIIKEISPEVLSKKNLHDILNKAYLMDRCPFSQNGIAKVIDENVSFEKLKKSKIDIYACAYNIDRFEPRYFYLNRFIDRLKRDAVLASSAIPYMYCPVRILGERYSDGGIAPFSIKNADNTPIKPLSNYRLSGIVTIHLNHNENQPTPINGKNIDIYPSKPLEKIDGTGTLNFSQKAIQENMNLGYNDTMKVFSKL